MEEPRNEVVDGADSERYLADLLWAYDERWRGTTKADNTSLSVIEAALDPISATRLENGRGAIDLLAWSGPRLAVSESKIHSSQGANPAVGTARDDSANDAGATTYFALGGSSTPPKLGRFEIIRELGRGGLGIVLLARDPLLDRDVALKVPRPEALLSLELRRRFDREGKAAARLTHPNIVPVYEVGQSGLIHFIAAAYIAGPSLANWSRTHRGSITPRLAAQIVAALADGISYAHSQKILHRDLKPANILLEPKSDGTSAENDPFEFVPRITDFGLAKLQDLDDGHTRTGMLLGTPAYMAPEQADRNLGDVGPATDIYGLGMILYELLTGAPAFGSMSDVETLRHVVSVEPRRPSAIRNGISPDLEAICLKCLEKNPKRRYESAATLASDLRRWLDGQPTEARPISAIEQGWRIVRRHPVASTLICSLIFLLTAVAIGSTYAALAISHARDDARQKAIAEQQARSRADAALESQRLQRQRAERAEGDAVKAASIAQAEARKAEQVAQFLAGIFQSSDPAGLGGIGLRRGSESIDQLTARQLLDRGVEQIDKQLMDQPLVRASLLDTLGNVYRSLGIYEPAERLLRESLAIRQQQLPADDAELAASLHHVGWLLHDLGRPIEAEPLLRRAAESLQNKFGADDLRVAEVKFNLAWALRDQSSDVTHVDEANALLEQVLVVRRNKLTENHRDIGVTLSALMALALDRSNEEGAKRLGLEALAIFLQQEGGEVLGQAMVAYNDATLERRQGNYQRAEELYRQTLDLVKQFLGPEHPVVVLLLGDLAGMQREACNLRGAEDTLRESVTIAQKLYPKGHPRIVEPLRELGLACAGRGELVEAEQLLRRALEICRANPATMQISAIRVLKDYAETIAVVGRVDEAQALLREARDCARRAYPQIAGAGNGELDHLAMILHAAGKDAEADAIWQQIVAVNENGFVQAHYAAALLDRGILDNVEKLLWHAERWTEDEKKPGHRFAKSTEMITYCRLLLRTGRADRAEPIVREMLALRESHCTRGHWHIAEAKALLGAALLLQAKTEEGRPLLSDAHLELVKILGSEHRVTKEAAGYLAMATQADVGVSNKSTEITAAPNGD